MSSEAERYEKAFPGTGCPEAQKQERQQRIDFKRERASLRRTGRNRGIVVPAIPWHTDDEGVEHE